MNISLSPNMEEIVKKRMHGGRYKDPVEVVQEALLLMEEHVAGYQSQLERLRHEVAEGVGELDRGDYVEQTVSEIIAEVRQEHGL